MDETVSDPYLEEILVEFGYSVDDLGKAEEDDLPDNNA